jgi:prepilin-type N-terminal cleavage/methylation domain-containing protein
MLGSCQNRSVGVSLVHRNPGFSLLELLVVMAVMLTIAAFAIPTLTTTMAAYNTRGALTSVAGLTQRCRLLAIKNNTSERMLFGVNAGGQVFVYCKDLANQGNAVLTTDPQITLTSRMAIPAVPTGANPTPLNALTMWGANFGTVASNTDPYFNSRGLPCSAPAAGAACNTISGYVYYLRYNGPNARWAAISISPAARVQTWFWNGNAWGN